MTDIVIEGGDPLNGIIEISSSKNAILPMIIASLLTDEQVSIKKVPHIDDVYNTLAIFDYLNINHCIDENDTLHIYNQKNIINKINIPSNLTVKTRTSILFLGALINRNKQISISHPGGCSIGKRPIDIHIDSFNILGIKIEYDDNNILCTRKARHNYNEINLKIPSIGATENIILASVISDSTTIINNCPIEPEVIDFINFINKMKGNIAIDIVKKQITINGVATLHNISYQAIPDRIELITYALGAIITKGEITIKNANINHIQTDIGHLKNIGAKIKILNDSEISFKYTNSLNGINLITTEFPGFSTDLQAQFTVLLSVANSISTITETIFENRFHHIAELQKMGGKYQIDNKTIKIYPINQFKSAELNGIDLRGTAALLLAALNANGKTIIKNVDLVYRGYNKIEDNILQCGGKIIKISK
ncbi:MAG: UDP-N-acetylglucosamine 1-carboxyvinyltransferase [Anaplasmataceae bacterium]|nr:UDP-N-acetylglucosamine 1-carboxyvinyltransferase [Anaplasmataceae bacterium]